MQPLKRKAPINVLIVENNALLREHLTALVHGAPGFRCAGAHASAEYALKSVRTDAPDVILLDLELPGITGVEAIPQFKKQLPQAQILIFTIHDEPDWIFPALEAGAAGYLVKPPSSSAIVLDAIVEVHAGGAPMSSQVARKVLRTFHQRGRSKADLAPLTPRENEILALLASGASPADIARQLGVASRTVSTHFRNIYEKLHVHTQAQAVAKYLRANTPSQA
jgi:DNA-binding NarL/FixJ family response regulator